MDNLDKPWHMIQSNEDLGLIEFELQLWRVFWAFYQWLEECQKASSSIQLSGLEVAILHTIRQNNKPKTLNDLGRLLNRPDSHNIRYGIKKLLNTQLIKKVKANSDSNKNIAFGISEKGIKVTDNYTLTRRKALIPLVGQRPDLGLLDIAQRFIGLKALYEEAERSAATYIKPQEFEDPERTDQNSAENETADLETETHF